MIDLLSRDRRTSRLGKDLTPAQVLQAQVDAAQRQLAEARQHLIAARRRVVELENAVENWAQMWREAPFSQSSN